MITVSKCMTYSNQDLDEQQRLLVDLKENPGDYLAHSDAVVRSLADWVMEFYGMRHLRPGMKTSKEFGERNLRQLWRRLRELAHGA